MKSLFRSLAAIVAGVLVAFALLIAVELFSAVAHPLPKDFDGTQEAMCLHVERYPGWVLAVVVPMWTAAALVSTWIAGKLGNVASAAIVGLLFLLALGFNIAMLPYPMWFKSACLIVIPLALGLLIYRSSRRPAANIAPTAA